MPGRSRVAVRVRLAISRPKMAARHAQACVSPHAGDGQGVAETSCGGHPGTWWRLVMYQDTPDTTACCRTTIGGRRRVTKSGLLRSSRASDVPHGPPGGKAPCNASVQAYQAHFFTQHTWDTDICGAQAPPEPSGDSLASNGAVSFCYGRAKWVGAYRWHMWIYTHRTALAPTDSLAPAPRPPA